MNIDHYPNAFIQAIQARSVATVEAFLEAQAPEVVLQQTAFGWHPLKIAVKLEDTSLVEMLAPRSDKTVVSQCLSKAMSLDMWNLVAPLAPWANPNYEDEFGNRALTHAILANELEATRLLLNNTRGFTNDEGCTALMLAAKVGHAELVDMLLGRSDVHDVDNKGYSALIYAIEGGHKNCIEKLLLVSNVHALDSQGKSAFDHALEQGNPEVTQLVGARITQLVIQELETAIPEVKTTPTHVRRL